MTKEKRVEILTATAEQKKQESLDKTEKAINKLLKEGKKLNFGTIAREAGVSISYLYKYPEIKERIQNLRKQQQEGEKLTSPQKASDQSKNVIISQLRDRIKRLEAERDGLRIVNEGITGRLYHLQGLADLAEKTKLENEELKRQLNEYRQNHVLSKTSTISKGALKVVPDNNKSSEHTNIGDQITSELKTLEIKMNSTLIKAITNTTEDECERLGSQLRETSSASSSAKIVPITMNQSQTTSSVSETLYTSEVQADNIQLEESDLIQLIKNMGIKVNSRLKREIACHESHKVKLSLDAFQQYHSKTDVENPAACLLSMIRDEAEPNIITQEPATKPSNQCSAVITNNNKKL